jgi:hypothetical protein
MKLNEKIAKGMVTLGLASNLLSVGAMGVEQYYETKRLPEEKKAYFEQVFRKRAPYYIAGALGGVLLMSFAPVVAGRPIEVLSFRRKKQNKQ